MNPRVNSVTLSLAIHSGVVALLLLLSSAVQHSPLPVHLLNPETLFTPTKLHLAASSGAGGFQQKTPATAGHLPPPVRNIFVPPALDVTHTPKLAVPMSIEAPPDTAIDLRALGDPLAHLVNGSAGTGGPFGIGNGPGIGVGDRRGPGAGGGDSDLGPIYRQGGGVTAPVLVHRVEPEFSEEARKAKYSGVVTIQTVIDSTGHARNMKITKSLGMGLDEKAINAVSQWLFRPGTKDGKPVPVSAVIEVSFRLL